MALLRVHKPGYQTTIQDLGRHGFAHLGISAGGAADDLSLRIGNLLVENRETAAGLEMTLTGGVFEFECESIIALTGSDCEPVVDTLSVPMWSSIVIKAGQILKCGAMTTAARSYLCIHGGIRLSRLDPPRSHNNRQKDLDFLGSASTHPLTGLGGLGRRLREGDVLEIEAMNHADVFKSRTVNSQFIPSIMGKDALRVTSGPQSSTFSEDVQELFYTSAFTVSEMSNRMGIRLKGPKLQDGEISEILTEGVSLGAVQVPSDGDPIILFVDHQTTGGYPKIANVISSDIHRLGQLKPRDKVRFESVSLEQAWSILKEHESLIHSHNFLVQV